MLEHVVQHEDALRIRDDVPFFQAVQSVLAKRTMRQVRTQEELDHAVRQIVSRAVASEGVIDIFAAAGLKKPDISIVSDEFLAEVLSEGWAVAGGALPMVRWRLSGGRDFFESRRAPFGKLPFARDLAPSPYPGSDHTRVNRDFRQ